MLTGIAALARDTRNAKLHTLSTEALRVEWRRAKARFERAAGKTYSFRYEVDCERNVIDGRCPDGCCGNENAPVWQPTPAEWVFLARRVAEGWERNSVGTKRAC